MNLYSLTSSTAYNITPRRDEYVPEIPDTTLASGRYLLRGCNRCARYSGHDSSTEVLFGGGDELRGGFLGVEAISSREINH